VVSPTDVHTSRLGYDVDETSDLIPLGIGRESKALVRMVVWGRLALGSLHSTAFS
jgi:hypothetical protein